MKKYGFPIFGASLYVIVTMIDIFVVSLPLSVYVSALAMGALLISVFFLGIKDNEDSKAAADETIKPMVFHIRRRPMI